MCLQFTTLCNYYSEDIPFDCLLVSSIDVAVIEVFSNVSGGVNKHLFLLLRVALSSASAELTPA